MSRFLRLLGSWSLSLGLIFASFCASESTAETTKSSIPAQVKQIDGYPFPADIAGFRRGQKADYNTAGLGFSVRYERSNSTWADIYIYDLGQNLKSADTRKASADQRDSALGDIDQAVSAGSYQSAKLIAKTEGPPFAKARLAITQKGTTRDSYVFVTVRKGNYVKIRLTSAAENADQLASRFASEFVRLLGK